MTRTTQGGSDGDDEGPRTTARTKTEGGEGEDGGQAQGGRTRTKTNGFRMRRLGTIGEGEEARTRTLHGDGPRVS